MQTFNCPLNRAFCNGCEYFKTNGCNFPYNTFYSYSSSNTMENNNIMTINVSKDKIIEFNDKSLCDDDTDMVLVKIPKNKDIKWVNNTLTLVNKDIPITERIKTFGDACRELGETHPYVVAYNDQKSYSGINSAAYLRLCIVCAALNEGWEPDFTQEEKKWHPVFYFFDPLSQEETMQKINERYKKKAINIDKKKFIFESSSCDEGAKCDINFSLFLKTQELSDYCGDTFIWMWADYLLNIKLL